MTDKNRRPEVTKPPAPTTEEIATARALLAEHWAGPLGLERWRGIGLPNPEPAWWRILGMAEGYGVSRELPGDAGAVTDLWEHLARPVVWTALHQNTGSLPILSGDGVTCVKYLPPFLAASRFPILLMWTSSERATGYIMAMRTTLGADEWAAPHLQTR